MRCTYGINKYFVQYLLINSMVVPNATEKKNLQKLLRAWVQPHKSNNGTHTR